eukprot:GFUD01028468.1.p1 GENE.GFUD01028468.1~~GFUD01028468.1.p1  ORF type:complete len:220 (-),score=82.92 GFUD01028468.1:95-715(-)
MEINEEIAEIVKHVHTDAQADSKGIVEIQKAIIEIENEGDNLGLFIEEKLNKILEANFKLERKVEKIKDERDEANQKLALAEGTLLDSKHQCEIAENQKKVSEEKLQKIKDDDKNFKLEAEKVSEMAANVPKLSQNKKMMYSISRLTLDKAVKEDEIKGFVVNPLKDDVNTFNFNTSDQGMSSHFITNYLWDLIAAGTSKEWTVGC